MEKNITLKIPQWEDMPFIRWLWGDPATMDPVGGQIHLTNEQAQHWFERMTNPRNQRDCYRLIVAEGNRRVGEISYHRWDPDTKSATFNLKVADRERGRGYAKAAMLLFLDDFFNRLGGRVLVDDVALENSAGQQALVRFGFEHDPSVKEVFLACMTWERFNCLYMQDG
jgi:RimJ/RimL family protein N-acetyltransferase